MSNKIRIEYVEIGKIISNTGLVLKSKYDVKEVTTEEGERYVKLGKMPFLNKENSYEIRVHLDSSVIEIPNVKFMHKNWYGTKVGNLELFYVKLDESVS